ncbi:glycoside hydrolase family 5 protein [Vibrio sp. 10N.286.51.F4]|uniref:glycoside hydrolase family 5 protein n=1 Tax=Vibrio sp. 10N.286.51.F4 TaxID=3229710 RepID=UPI00354C58A7
MKIRSLISLSTVLVGLLFNYGCGSSSESSEEAHVVLNEAYYSDLYDWNETNGLAHSFLGRGINMGNYLESPNYEGEWNANRLIQSSDFENIHNAGFASVRVPIRWSAHAMEAAPYTIEPVFLARVQQVVDEAIQQGLRVIINTHHYEELFYNQGEFELHRARLKAIWTQLADQFPLGRYPQDQLVFELLNEPHEVVGVDEWNTLIDDLVSVLWTEKASEQNNDLEQRKIMVGTADWGGPFKLPDLNLPAACDASNTIITVHFYEPFKFTHQGADWTEGASDWIGTRWLGSDAEQQTLFTYLDAVAQWNDQPGREFEVNIGEFGVYSQFSKAEDQRAWTAFIARESEKRGFSWHYWEYSAGFGAYDAEATQWRTSLIEGLIPTDR